MIKTILKFSVRKDIPKYNKALNHKSLSRSLPFSQYVPFIAKYHKKKLVAFILAGVIIYTYDFQKVIIRKIMSFNINSPVNFLSEMIVGKNNQQIKFIGEHEYKGIDIEEDTVKRLTVMYYLADQGLYFGVGRYYLYQVYDYLGLLDTEDKKVKFWRASGFFKERNQKASGVGLSEFLSIFEEGLVELRKKDPNLTERDYYDKFQSKFVEVFKEVQKWQQNFNQERNEQFLKNMPGENDKKKDAIIQIFKQSIKEGQSAISEASLNEKIKQLGLKGLNLTDKVLYWDLKRVWDTVAVAAINKKISHPLVSQSEKSSLEKRKEVLIKDIQEAAKKIQQNETQFQKLYDQPMF